MPQKNKFMVVEDDKAMFKILEKVILKIFPKADLHYAEDGIDAIKKLIEIGEPIVVVSDILMPRMNGVQLLKKIRTTENIRDCYIIMITADAESREQNIKMLQEGADDFLAKPFQIDQMIGKLRAGARIMEQRFEIFAINQKVLELTNKMDENYGRVVNSLEILVNVRSPEFPKLKNRVQRAASWIADELGDMSKSEKEEFEDACRLVFLGRLMLPDNILLSPILVDGREKSEQMSRVPKFSYDLLLPMDGFAKPAKILKHVYENFDGTGIPDKIKGWEIPLGSRILRVVLDFYDFMKATNDQIGKSIENLYHEGKRLYDIRIITLMDQYFAWQNSTGKYKTEMTVSRRELEEGMTLSRNIITQSGIKLMSADTVLSEEKLEKILMITKGDPVIGKMYVKRK
ncbi:MAG: response regulator [Candidatus Kapaibacterium sp.]